MLDELGFFLHCRYMLFKGPELNQSGAKYIAANFIDLEKAIETALIMMKELPEKERTELVDMLESKATDNEGSKAIECSLVLRVMVEYYRHEKKLKYFSIVELFNAAKNANKDDIDYSTFHTICKNISNNITESVIIKLYRDC